MQYKDNYTLALKFCLSIGKMLYRNVFKTAFNSVQYNNYFYYTEQKLRDPRDNTQMFIVYTPFSHFPFCL